MKTKLVICALLLLVVCCLWLVASGCSRPNGAILSQQDIIRNESNSTTWDMFIYNESSMEVVITTSNWRSDFYSQPYFKPGPAGVYTAILLPGQAITLEVSLSPNFFLKNHAMDIVYCFVTTVEGTRIVVPADQRVDDINGYPAKDLADGQSLLTVVGTKEHYAVISPVKYESSQSFDRETTAEDMTRAIGLDPSKIPGKWVKDAFKAALTKYSYMLWVVQYNYTIIITDYVYP